MNTYHVTIYTKVACNYIVEAATPAQALADARSQDAEGSLNERVWEQEDGYSVTDTATQEAWWDDENSLDEVVEAA